MEANTNSKISCRGATGVDEAPRGGLTHSKGDKVVALQRLMRGRYQPLPRQLLNIIRVLPHEVHDPVEGDPEWLYCASFLVSREWDVQRAFAMMQEVVDYRIANDLDARSQLPPAVSVHGWGNTEAVYASLGKPPRHVPDGVDHLAAGVAENLACGIHYWDKGGRPVVYVMINSLDAPGLIKTLKNHAKIGQKPADVLWAYGQHFIGAAEDLVLYQLQQRRGGEEEIGAAESHTPTSSSPAHSTSFGQGLVTLVVDLKGLHMGLLWKPMLDVFRDVTRSLFKFYPDMVHRVIAVNAPGLVRVAFNMVRGAMPADFQKKISFVGPPHSLQALSEEIDVAYIPAFLGGSCCCRPENAEEGNDSGGCSCIDGYDPADPLRHTLKVQQGKHGTSAAEDSENGRSIGEGDAFAPTEDILLSAGQRHRRVFHLQPSETVAWEFAVSHSGTDIEFSAFFIPHADAARDAAEMDWPKLSDRKLQPHQLLGGEADKSADVFTAAEGGTLVLSWHNRRSWFKKYNLQLRVHRSLAS
ncbi:hypothetical protein ABL78_3417 [Leptomonas seymouri]|uniref:CRAL-TRIO domain-containing protein n=1 Tax=Leptomonas seymouri TaxID=5684 RepID=A0A0N0P6D4_LEPSE|nr:hypothetical protein ABL78_3417 [Leptomonas seymouri]|eukprot:KPI87506.1 hypothetical protein ABL78_3417 [Leptomonas seymouri]